MSDGPVCELCVSPGGELLWEDDRLRVIRVGGSEGRAFPGFCRVVWRDHVAEMSELSAADARHLLAAVSAVERALRELLRPDKINLASLGNVVPHLHWHVIPRWRDDSHFPRPIWADALRDVPARPEPTTADLASALQRHLATESAHEL